MISKFLLPLAAIAALASATLVRAGDPAPFDLVGPTVEVTVTRGATTLPIAQVPDLAVNDRLWIKADLPPTQSAHYIMVAAFLRGATNPPPANWFFLCETWSRRCAQDGLTLTVPQDAQQLLLFLAPETGGDFKTLVNAVRGRPGAFVRASQDLNQAALDRARLQAYLSAIRALDESDPARLKDVAPLLARSLAIKLDDKCLDRITAVQAPCLTQGQNSLILNDGHSTSIVEALTSGPASDLAMEASFTQPLSYGYYSPYIASVLDIARILDSFHTAQYQYIPALASQQDKRLVLSLNTPPSFNNPKSVLVTALPAIEQPQLPPLHGVDPAESYCARKAPLVLATDGAPLAFATGYAHDMALSVAGKDGKLVELPAHADAQRGGFVVDTSALANAALTDAIRGSLHGYWGFEKYDGPSFQLVSAHAQKWQLDSADEAALIVGREDTVHLQAGSTSCVAGVTLKDTAGRELKTEWKAVGPDALELKLPLQQAKPGTVTVLVTQDGMPQPQAIPLHAFAEAGRLDRFELHAGDTQGILKGTRLDEVAGLAVKGMQFLPGKLSSSQGVDELPMLATDLPAAVALKPGDATSARVALKDGRVLDVNAVVNAPRPRVSLLGKSVQASPTSGSSNILLANQDEVPQDARLTFSVRTQSPAAFTYDEKIEVAPVNKTSSAVLSFDNGGITLQDAQVAVATLDPARALGPSSFGPLQFRVVTHDALGDWQPLATLVRLPALNDLKCPASRELACKLSGSSLFLVDSVSSTPQFDHPVQVPDGFPGAALPVPRPTDGQLYVKLRDDPSVINATTLVTQQLPPSVDEIARASARHAAAGAVGEPGSNSGSSAPPPATSPASAPTTTPPAPAGVMPSAPTAAPGASNAAAGDATAPSVSPPQ
ncbi:MAG: hypothetical protein ACHQDD_04310 [Steroidobacterales bacterium]